MDVPFDLTRVKSMADGQWLASWNDGAAKSAMLDFVARVTRQGGTESCRQPNA